MAEASVSDRGVLRVRALVLGDAGDLPEGAEVALDGVPLGRALRQAVGPGRFAYLLVKDLGEHPPAPGGRVTVTPDGWALAPAPAPLTGRLGPAAPGWFADATWTASPDVLAALVDPRPAALLLADALPQQGAADWVSLANLAAALRRAGRRTVLLHYGRAADLEDDLGEVLRHVDLLHHHSIAAPARAWDPEAPGAMPAVDQTLVPVVAGVAAASGAELVVAASTTALGLLRRLPAGLPSAALLPRRLALAPRRIFAPVPREKAVAALGGLLAGSTAIVEDEGLALELSRWRPGARAAVLPPEAALAGADAAPPWDAEGFASELGLSPRPSAGAAPGFLRRLLALRLGGPDEREGVGLLVQPGQAQAPLLAAAFTALRGPGLVFARNPWPGLPGLRPLAEAPGLGVRAVLLELPEERASALAAMERVVESGLAPLPLAPRAGWTDRAGLARWRGARPGATAYVGPGPAPAEADLVLLPGAAEAGRADAVELRGPDDPRRGALLTVFDAGSDSFWRRPPAPALGYDRDDAAVGLDIEAGLAVAHPAVPMLALARLLGCARVLLPVDLLPEPALVPALRALAAAGIAVGPAP
ncbi:hypothetical protein [Muricoccus nepalensis]|uniref:hypothetical protein n=1 Tax=Muricoccus nepalensis TaxID=1854500 RepID=UPI001386FFAD|nr:hypothetical protein [Roseomonas nepalensis]